MKKRLCIALVGLGLAGPGQVLSSGEPYSEVCGAFWTSSLGNGHLPEQAGPYAVPWLKERPSFGIAFSGGGSRSAAATLGQLRGLHHSGLLDRAQYLSAVSGASWVVVPFTYAAKADLDTFLGPFLEPEAIEAPALRRQVRGAFAKTLDGLGFIAPRLLSALGKARGNESWSEVTGREFLKPHGLFDRNAGFSFHSTAIEHFRTSNSRFTPRIDTIDDRRKPPFPLISGVVQCDQREHPLEITPLYTGIPPWLPRKEVCGIDAQFVESLAFDNVRGSEAKCHDETEAAGLNRRRVVIQSQKDLFTLSDMIGISSAVVPNWRLTGSPTTRGRKDRAIPLRDGGHLDNLGLLPLLARQLENIVVFVNTWRTKDDEIMKPFLPYFSECSSGTVAGCRSSELHLFDPEGISAIEASFRHSKSSGKPPLHCGELRVARGNWLGIPEYTPRICWLLLDRTREWIMRLEPRDRVTRRLKEGERPFRTFPNYATSRAEGSRIQVGDLDKKEINAVAHLTSWTVMEVASQLLDPTRPTSGN